MLKRLSYKFKCTLYFYSEIHAQFFIQTEETRLQEKGMNLRAINTLTFDGAK